MDNFQPDYSEYESGKTEIYYFIILTFLYKLFKITPNNLFDCELKRLSHIRRRAKNLCLLRKTQKAHRFSF